MSYNKKYPKKVETIKLMLLNGKNVLKET